MKQAPVLDLQPYRLSHPDDDAAGRKPLPDFVRNWIAVAEREMATRTAA